MEQQVTVKRLAGVVIAFVTFVVFLTALILVVESMYDQRTAASVGKVFTYSGFGVAYAGWQWPDFFLRPFVYLWGLIRPGR